MAHADVVVVGAGIVGCSVAYELSKRNLSVIVVERGEIGREASWSAGGILTPVHLAEYPTPLADLCSLAQRGYPAFIEELRAGASEDFEYQVSGMLLLVRSAEDEATARTLEEWKRRNGQPCERRSDGLLLPDIAQVRNNRLTRAIAAAAAQRGVEFRSSCPVNGFLKIPGRINGVQTAQGYIQAGTTIITAGAWSGDLFQSIGFTMPVRPVKGQILLLQGPPGLLPHMLLHRGQYLVQRRDGRILVGSTAEETGFDVTVTAGATRFLLARAFEMRPDLESLPLVASWAGLRPATPDRLPFIGPVPGHEGLIAATGHFRNGILLGPLTGRLVADLLTAQPDTILQHTRLNRPLSMEHTS